MLAPVHSAMLAGAYISLALPAFVDLPGFLMIILMEWPLSSLSLCTLDRHWPGPLPRVLGSGATQGLSFRLAVVRRITLPFSGYRLPWLVPKLGGGWGQARWDGDFSVPHWWNVDIKAGASAATVELWGEVKQRGHTRNRAELSLPLRW